MAYLDIVAWEEAGKRGEEIRTQEQAADDAQRREDIERAVRAAAQQIIGARADGMRSAAFGRITQFERDIIDVQCYAEISPGQDFSSRLRGPWATLRDELRSRGIGLSATSRYVGTSSNAGHWAFELVARW